MLAFCTTAFIVAFACNKPKYLEFRALERQYADLANRVNQKRLEVEDLNRRCVRFENDPEFVERQARLNHMIRPGETEFVFDLN